MKISLSLRFLTTTIKVCRRCPLPNLNSVNATSSTTIAAGDSDVVNASYSAAVAATIETTSLSLGSAVGDIAWSLAATTGDDRGDSAAKGSVTYSGIENLSLTLAHDNVGKLEGISKVTAKYTMGSLTATLSMADDKNKNSNSNAHHRKTMT